MKAMEDAARRAAEEDEAAFLAFAPKWEGPPNDGILIGSERNILMACLRRGFFAGVNYARSKDTR